ncbi:MAG: NAD(P)/FAD-dependent oxidoreductase, partial [Dehalococcoidia bacterium]
MQVEFDVIIIGGGPGGLAIGSLLAREGVSSAIMEKDPVLGGRYRSVDFHGCRVDSATHFLVSLSGSTEKTATYEYFSELGLPMEQKMVPWTIGLVSKER